MYYVYILSNAHDTVLYTGVTGDLVRRISEHKNDVNDGFTKKYQVHKLVFYECFSQTEDAILREKKVKKLSRTNKEKLINRMNPQREDLFADFV